MMLSDNALDGTFEVVGSTVIPVEPHLPCYLHQILRASDGSIYLEDHDGFTRSFSYHGPDLDDLEPYLPLQPPVPAKPHHRLMQFEPSQPPQYLSDGEALLRLEDSGLRHIEIALQTLSQGDKDAARRSALYAYNALPSYYARPRLLLHYIVEARHQRDKLERELSQLPKKAIDEQRRHLRLQIEQHVTNIEQRASLLSYPLLQPPSYATDAPEDPKRAFIRCGRKAQADAHAA